MDYSLPERTSTLPAYFSKSFADKRGLFVVGLLSLSLKLTIALLTKVVNPDGILYIAAAHEIASGSFKGSLEIYPMPLYPLLIAAFHLVVPNWELAARLISVLSSTLAIIPLYLITEHLFNRTAAFWACALFALSPAFNGWAADVIRDPLFLLFFAFAIYCAVRAIDDSRRILFFLLTALFSGISFLFRVEGVALFFLFPFFIAYLFRYPELRRNLMKGIGAWASLPLIGVLGLSVFAGSHWSSISTNRINEITLWLHNFLHFGFLQGYKAVYEKLNVFESSLLGGGYTANFAETARHYIFLVYFIGELETLVRVIFPPSILLIFLGLNKQSLQRAHFFILFIGASYFFIFYCVLINNGFIANRFMIVPAFLLYPFIGSGMERLLGYISKCRGPKIAAIAISCLFFILPLYKSFAHILHQDLTVRVAGEWLAGKDEFVNAKIISNSGQIPFYAHRWRNYIPCDTSDYKLMEQNAVLNQCDLLIIKAPVSKKSTLPEHTSYIKLIELTGNKIFAAIFCSPSFKASLQTKSPL